MGLARRLTEPADRCVDHRLREFHHQRFIPHISFHQFHGLCTSNSARRALAANFLFEKAERVQCGSLRRVRLRQYHNGAGAGKTPVLFECPKIHRDIGHGGGKYAAQAPPGR